MVHAGGDQRHLRVGAVGVALVDDPVAELEEPRHVPLAVLVVEGDERHVALGGRGIFEPRRSLHFVLLAAVGRALVAAGVEGQRGLRPGA